jgi:hypothetical protein
MKIYAQRPMSAIGTKQTSVCLATMSAVEVRRTFIELEGHALNRLKPTAKEARWKMNFGMGC